MGDHRTARVMFQLIAYVTAYAAASMICFNGVFRAGALDADAAVGMRALLATAGLWAAVQVLVVVVPIEPLMVPLYVVAQIVGFATIGAWLYFCSAYTGRTIHQRPRYWAAWLLAYAAVATAKITQPIHGVYVESTVATEPFLHLAVGPGAVYWTILAAAYVLAGVGFYWIVAPIVRADPPTKPLSLPFAALLVPAVPTAISLLRPELLLPLNYEPLGIAAFAVGMLFVFDRSFLDAHASIINDVEADTRSTTGGVE